MEVVVEELRCSFGKVEAVGGVSFRVPSGTITALLGPSGCGKTTILRCLAGLQKPTSGTIRFANNTVYSHTEHINVPPEKRKLGMIFQDFALWPHLRVFDNVAFGLKLRRLPRVEIRERVERALALVHLQDLARRYPHELSGGQQQRIAVARAVVTEPQLLLLDEPLSSLDSGLREKMRQDLGELIRDLGITAVHVTHDHVEALSIASEVIVIDNGRVEQSGKPVDVYAHPRNLFVAGFLGSMNVITGSVENDANGVSVTRGTWRIVGESRYPLNGRAHAIVRPSSVRVVEPHEAGDDNRLKGMVRAGYFHGDYWQYDIAGPDGTTFKVQTSSELQVGSEVDFTFSCQACQIIS